MELLKRTAKSLEAQTSKNFEWIVVDGGSKDGTKDFLEANQLVHHWISEPDDGISDAWNKGINLATSDYILILNSGDIYDNRFVEYIENNVFDNKIYCANARIATLSGKVVGEFKAQPKKLSYGMYLPHNWAIVPSKIYEEFGLYNNLKFSMDFDWFHRYYKKVGIKGFIVIDKTFGTYELGGLSDKSYIDGFISNANIMKKNGKNKYLAYSIAFIHIIKHKVSGLIK